MRKTTDQVPKYPLEAFSRHEPDPIFYVTSLQQLVLDFKGIDRPHSHTFYLVMWIRRGSGTHTIDFKTYDLAPNQLYFLTPGQVHSWQLSADMEGYNLYFDAPFFRSRFGGRLFQYPFFHSHQHQPLLEVVEKQAAFFQDIIHATYLEYHHHRATNPELLASYVHILLENATRLYSQQVAPTDTHYYDRLRQYEELLEQHFLSIRQVKDYAALMHLSPNHLNHICRQLLNKTASQLYQERLLVEAQRLLTHTSQTVQEVGYLLGFEDPSYFVRFFKKHTGTSPAHFRQQQVPHH
ncbi:helix-turn-helix transcriptional regulator [Rhabdobacter roseus]|uniref:AraC-like DNA-binding protein n=1 Tax=Rhabdobacter roseus TaxID=1655419 RepID=A0A840TGM8_9BACT|nr:helix-turn-helix domain-containing protein [Rhabdobacter roseus]MBB5283306.1 AraC-like DNA-binding protein [Rhabdobacter roseus]